MRARARRRWQACRRSGSSPARPVKRREQEEDEDEDEDEALEGLPWKRGCTLEALDEPILLLSDTSRGSSAPEERAGETHVRVAVSGSYDACTLCLPSCVVASSLPSSSSPKRQR